MLDMGVIRCWGGHDIGLAHLYEGDRVGRWLMNEFFDLVNMEMHGAEDNMPPKSTVVLRFPFINNIQLNYYINYCSPPRVG